MAAIENLCHSIESHSCLSKVHSHAIGTNMFTLQLLISLQCIWSFGQWLAIIETIINSLFHRVSRTQGRNSSIQTQGSSPWKIASRISKSVFRSVQNHCSWFKEWQSEPKTRPWSEKYDNWNLSFVVSILWGAVTSSHLMKISKVKTPSEKVTRERDPPV